jgi:hypothetical protein
VNGPAPMASPLHLIANRRSRTSSYNRSRKTTVTRSTWSERIAAMPSNVNRLRRFSLSRKIKIGPGCWRNGMMTAELHSVRRSAADLPGRAATAGTSPGHPVPGRRRTAGFLLRDE